MSNNRDDFPRMSVEEFMKTEEFPTLEELRELDQESVQDFDPGITSSEQSGISQRASDYLKNYQASRTRELPTFDQLMQKAEKLLESSQAFVQKPYPIDYEASRELFWHIFKRKLGEAPVLDGNLRQQLKALLLYFTGHPDSPYPHRKGIYLFGDVGIGKTALMESLSIFTQTLGYKYFRLANVRDISFRIQRKKETALLDAYQNGNWCIDDLFADQEQSKIYGNSTDVSKVLIEQFYIHGWRQGKKLHITSNIEPEEIGKQISDPRFVDRIREMMTPVEIIGESKRG